MIIGDGLYPCTDVLLMMVDPGGRCGKASRVIQNIAYRFVVIVRFTSSSSSSSNVWWYTWWAAALAADLAPRGIRVNAVAPGPVWTPLQVSDGQPSEKLDGFGDSSWLGRTSQPVEQAPAYVFLASPESSFVVGEVINVNGGANVP
jgi:NAD(P)-dependent dehydrogenase (short-subunit alcohol dehydrogenase family)